MNLPEVHEKLSQALPELSRFTINDIDALWTWCQELSDYLEPHDPDLPFDILMLQACLRLKLQELREIDRDAGGIYTRQDIFDWRVSSTRRDMENAIRFLASCDPSA